MCSHFCAKIIGLKRIINDEMSKTKFFLKIRLYHAPQVLKVTLSKKYFEDFRTSTTSLKDPGFFFYPKEFPAGYRLSWVIFESFLRHFLWSLVTMLSKLLVSLCAVISKYIYIMSQQRVSFLFFCKSRLKKSNQDRIIEK